jgi:hypothetical protein
MTRAAHFEFATFVMNVASDQRTHGERAAPLARGLNVF